MLSIRKLAAGQQQYYEAEVARGLEEYYSGIIAWEVAGRAPL